MFSGEVAKEGVVEEGGKRGMRESKLPSFPPIWQKKSAPGEAVLRSASFFSLLLWFYVSFDKEHFEYAMLLKNWASFL